MTKLLRSMRNKKRKSRNLLLKTKLVIFRDKLESKFYQPDFGN